MHGLIERYLPDLERFVGQRVGAVLRWRESTSDLVHSACHEARGSFDFRGEDRFRAWLFRQGRERARRRAPRDVVESLAEDVANDPQDAWYVLPWGLASLRGAELAAAAGDTARAAEVLAAELAKLQAVCAVAHADQWDEAAFRDALDGRGCPRSGSPRARGAEAGPTFGGDPPGRFVVPVAGLAGAAVAT